MTTPELTRSSRYESVDGVSTGITLSRAFLTWPPSERLALLIVGLLRSGVIHLDSGLRFQRTQRLVAAHDNFVARLQTLSDFNIRYAGNPSIHRLEYRLLAVDHKYALYFVLLRIAARGDGRRSGQRHAGVAAFLGALRGLIQILARAHSQRLNRNGDYILLFRRLDLGSRRKPRAQVLWRRRQRYHHLEIFRFLRAGGRLRGRQSRTAQHRLRPDSRHRSLEYLPGNRIDGDVGKLSDLHVYNIRLVYFHFRCDDRHIRQRHQEAAVRILNSRHHVLTQAHRQVTDDAIYGRYISRFLQNVFGVHQHGTALVHLRTRLSQLRIQRLHPCFGGSHSRHGAVISC